MDREYDLFELLPDSSSVWRGHTTGLLDVRAKLEELAKSTTNECYAIHLPTKQVVARLNIRASRVGGGKRLIFQISYNAKQAAERTEILRMCGYEVVSAIGNEAARVILGMQQHCDLFIVGHSAPEEARKKMAAWLKSKYPGVPILALNSSGIKELAGADYNVRANGPETWLRLVTAALGTT